MHFSNIAAAVACASAFMAFPAPAADNPPASIVLYARTKVAIDESGYATVQKVESIEPLKPGNVIYNRIADALPKRIASWVFVPAASNGQTIASETHVFIRLDAKDDGNGNLALTIRNANTGAGLVDMAPPRYPPAAFRMGSEGKVVLVVRYDADGRVVGTEVETSADSRGAGRDFRKAASRAAQDWTFVPEHVGGMGIAGSVRVPISFCLSAGCSGFTNQDLPAGNDAVALDPAVKLRSAVAGTAL